MRPGRTTVGREPPQNCMQGKGAVWALSPLLRASRLLGLAPVTLGQGECPRPSLSWRLYSVVLFLTLTALGCWSGKRFAEMYLDRAHPVNSGGFLTVVIQHVAAMIAVASSCWDGGLWVQDLIDQLLRVDRILKIKLPISIYTKIRRNSIILLTIFLFIFSLMYLSQMVWNSLNYFCVFFLGMFLSEVFIIRYDAAISLLNHHILQLNIHLLEHCKMTQIPHTARKLLDMSHKRNFYQFITSDTVNRVSEAYSVLYDVSFLIGMRLGVSMLGQLLKILVGMVTWGFMLLYILQWASKFDFPIMNIVMPLHNSLLFIWISVRSHVVTENARQTSRLVHRLLIQLQQMQYLHPKSIESTRALRHLSLQLLHERLQLNAAGLLPLDRTLLLGAAAFVFTNILILLQFAIKEPEKSLDSFRQATTQVLKKERTRCTMEERVTSEEPSGRWQRCYSVAQLMWISMESHNVMEQGELTSQLVHRQLLRLQSMQSSSARMIEMSWALQQMSLQLLHERLHVRVAGLLPLDRTLLLGAAGCLFTNVLILLQFATQDFVAPLEDA